MHRKAVFFLAGVFLAVALIAPPVILILQADKDLDNYIVSQNPTGHETNGNITTLTPAEIQENHNNTFIGGYRKKRAIDFSCIFSRCLSG